MKLKNQMALVAAAALLISGIAKADVEMAPGAADESGLISTDDGVSAIDEGAVDQGESGLIQDGADSAEVSGDLGLLDLSGGAVIVHAPGEGFGRGGRHGHDDGRRRADIQIKVKQATTFGGYFKIEGLLYGEVSDVEMLVVDRDGYILRRENLLHWQSGPAIKFRTESNARSGAEVIVRAYDERGRQADFYLLTVN